MSKDCVGNKIRLLMKEGKPHKQAIAIALSMCGESNKKKRKSFYSVKSSFGNQIDAFVAKHNLNPIPKELRIAIAALEQMARLPGGTSVGAPIHDDDEKLQLDYQKWQKLNNIYRRNMSSDNVDKYCGSAYFNTDILDPYEELREIKEYLFNLVDMKRRHPTWYGFLSMFKKGEL